MARLGIAPHVVERVLNHVSGTFSGVAGIYNRFRYEDEMRAALIAWEKAQLNSSIMNDDEFEWDDAKASANLVKHKVSFEQARRAFADVFSIERDDVTENYDEPRSTLFGMVDGKVLFVAYTVRGDTIRIISAREAEPYERRLYHEENGQ